MEERRAQNLVGVQRWLLASKMNARFALDLHLTSVPTAYSQALEIRKESTHPTSRSVGKMADAEQDYEAIRQENIRKNAELMLSLGLDSVSYANISQLSTARKSAARTISITLI